jgi:hypothetical protein
MSDGKIAGMATALAELRQADSNPRQLARKAMKNPRLLEELTRGLDANQARIKYERSFGAGRLPALRRIVCSSDRAIVDRCQEWFDLAHQVVANHVPQARIVGPGLEESAQAGG